MISAGGTPGFMVAFPKNGTDHCQLNKNPKNYIQSKISQQL
jgi:hypothetical protein